MKYKIKLVQGSEDVINPPATPFKRKHMNCNVSLSDNQLKKMKMITGLRGKHTDQFVIQEFLKYSLRHGY